MSADKSDIHTKIRDAENEIDRLERAVTTVIFVTVPLSIATYSTLLGIWFSAGGCDMCPMHVHAAAPIIFFYLME